MPPLRTAAEDLPLSERLLAGLRYPLRGGALATCAALGLCHYAVLLPSVSWIMKKLSKRLYHITKASQQATDELKKHAGDRSYSYWFRAYNIEAKKFLEAVSGGEAVNSNIHDAVSAAAIVSAAETSAASGQWQKLESVPGTTASRIDG